MELEAKKKDKEEKENEDKKEKGKGKKKQFPFWLKKKKKAELMNQLVKLADSLDSKGLVQEAEEVDGIIKEAEGDDSFQFLKGDDSFQFLNEKELVIEIMKLVNQWESTEKSEFIEQALLPHLNKEQLEGIWKQLYFGDSSK